MVGMGTANRLQSEFRVPQLPRQGWLESLPYSQEAPICVDVRVRWWCWKWRPSSGPGHRC